MRSVRCWAAACRAVLDSLPHRLGACSPTCPPTATSFCPPLESAPALLAGLCRQAGPGAAHVRLSTRVPAGGRDGGVDDYDEAEVRAAPLKYVSDGLVVGSPGVLMMMRGGLRIDGLLPRLPLDPRVRRARLTILELGPDLDGEGLLAVQ